MPRVASIFVFDGPLLRVTRERNSVPGNRRMIGRRLRDHPQIAIESRRGVDEERAIGWMLCLIVEHKRTRFNQCRGSLNPLLDQNTVMTKRTNTIGVQNTRL